jgi:hypothetical protein
MHLKEPQELMQQYERGEITDGELLYRLIQVALFHSPESIVPLLSPEMLRKLREQSATPPTSSEDAPRLFCAGSWIGPFDHDEEIRENQRLWYEGAWKWHRHFK